jgi:CubicO group peptidase (beta-lactamase class C family)
MKAEITARVERALSEHVFPGCVIGVIQRGIQTQLPLGRFTYESTSPAVTDETVYDLASITKSIPTATLALQHIDERALSLESRLIEFVPEYRGEYRDEILIKHLLTYTLDGLQMSALTSVEDIDRAVFNLHPAHPPGAHFAYTNLPAYLLGLVVERRGGPLDRQAQDRIFSNFGMSSTTFKPQGAVPAEEGVRDIVYDESARVLARAGRTAGHAGLFSNVPDLLKFAATLLKKRDPRLETNYLAHIGAPAALGWELNQLHFMGALRSEKTFGKTGFTGTSIVVDFDRQTAIVILSNRTYPKRPRDARVINQFRSDVCDIVFRS